MLHSCAPHSSESKDRSFSTIRDAHSEKKAMLLTHLSKDKCYIREHHMFKLQPTDQDLLILSLIEIGGKRFHT